MQATDTKKHVEVNCADGTLRHLRFTLGAKKRICEKFGQDPLEMLKTPPEVLLPIVLAEGLIERDGVDESTIMENLVEAPMTDYFMLQFVESFFVPRVAQNLRRVYEAINRNGEIAIAALEKTGEQTKPEIEPSATTVQ